MSKIQPTRRSRASAQSRVARPTDDTGEGASDTYPEPEPPRRKGSGDLKPDPDIDLGGLEWEGAPGSEMPEDSEGGYE